MLFKRIQEDIDSYMARDPAVRSRLEVALCYPGFHAVMFYRVSHTLWDRDWHLLGRFLAHIGRFLTSIEIHPGARIGCRLFIDHGHGVVIGETSEIGDDVTLYQGVTLGGIAPSVDSASQINVKRHPTLKDGAIIGSGAQVLGPITVGEGARVGANAVVSKDIPPGVTAIGIPAHVVMPRDRSRVGEFVAYGTPAEGCPDPVLATIESLRGQLATLVGRVSELEESLVEAEADKPTPVHHVPGNNEDDAQPAVASGGEHG